MIVSVVPSANSTDRLGLPSSDLSSSKENDGTPSLLLLMLGKAEAMPKTAIRRSDFILDQLVTGITCPSTFYSVTLRILENGIDVNGSGDVRRVHKKNVDVSVDTQYTYMNLFNLTFAFLVSFERHTF